MSGQYSVIKATDSIPDGATAHSNFSFMLNGHTFDMEHRKVPYANKCGETLSDQSLKKRKKIALEEHWNNVELCEKKKRWWPKEETKSAVKVVALT